MLSVCDKPYQKIKENNYAAWGGAKTFVELSIAIFK